MREDLKAVIVIDEESTPEELDATWKLLKAVQEEVDKQVDPEAEFISFN